MVHPNTKLTDRLKHLFLQNLRLTAEVSSSAKVIGITTTSLYTHRKKDREFAKDWDEAITEAAGRFEEEAYRRGLKGVEKPVYYQGKIVGKERVYDNKLLLRSLARLLPDKWGDKVEHTGPGGAPLQLESKIILRRSDEVEEKTPLKIVNPVPEPVDD